MFCFSPAEIRIVEVFTIPLTAPQRGQADPSKLRWQSGQIMAFRLISDFGCRMSDGVCYANGGRQTIRDPKSEIRNPSSGVAVRGRSPGRLNACPTNAANP
jgi:hypothetical protein